MSATQGRTNVIAQYPLIRMKSHKPTYETLGRQDLALLQDFRLLKSALPLTVRIEDLFHRTLNILNSWLECYPEVSSDQLRKEMTDNSRRLEGNKLAALVFVSTGSLTRDTISCRYCRVIQSSPSSRYLVFFLETTLRVGETLMEGSDQTFQSSYRSKPSSSLETGGSGSSSSEITASRCHLADKYRSCATALML